MHQDDHHIRVSGIRDYVPTSDGEILSQDHLEFVNGWGGSVRSAGYVYRPANQNDLLKLFNFARRVGRTVVLRGAGRSYGDAALNAENIVLDMSQMNRILSWDAQSGIIDLEPGVTIGQLWRFIIKDGWWPPVVPGTMFPTIGGCAAMNIHGKNNFASGPIGEHILDFTMMFPDGTIQDCSPGNNSELFYAGIGGLGMLGCFLRLRLRMKKIDSGDLLVRPVCAPNLNSMFSEFNKLLPGSDYLVGWIDGLAKGASLGRGVIHQARYVTAGQDASPNKTLSVDHQELPGTIMGVLPKSILWRLMRPLTNNAGVRLTNALKYRLSRITDRGRLYKQSAAGFSFLLDYVPGWKKAYGSGGLIQYQSFVPSDMAQEVFRKQLEQSQAQGMPSYLAVLKKHRPDKFLLSHAVDGYSLALDFKVTERNKAALWQMARSFDEMVFKAGGRKYFAKDITMEKDDSVQILSQQTVDCFRTLKTQYDPEMLLESQLWRRLFPNDTILHV